MRKKPMNNMKSKMKRVMAKSGLLMEIAEELMDVALKAKRLKRMNKKHKY